MDGTEDETTWSGTPGKGAAVYNPDDALSGRAIPPLDWLEVK
jgi:hypothetical protein